MDAVKMNLKARIITRNLDTKCPVGPLEYKDWRLQQVKLNIRFGGCIRSIRILGLEVASGQLEYKDWRLHASFQVLRDFK